MTKKLHFCLLIILFAIPSFSFSQEKEVDSLFEQLDNSAIQVDGNYFGPFLILVGKPAVEISEKAKKLTKNLYSLLDDSTKGVVAHYILTMTWKLPINSEKMIYSERDRIYFVSFNELIFFIRDHENKVYANKRELESNKLLWGFYLKKIGAL